MAADSLTARQPGELSRWRHQVRDAAALRSAPSCERRIYDKAVLDLSAVPEGQEIFDFVSFSLGLRRQDHHRNA